MSLQGFVDQTTGKSIKEPIKPGGNRHVQTSLLARRTTSKMPHFFTHAPSGETSDQTPRRRAPVSSSRPDRDRAPSRRLNQSGPKRRDGAKFLRINPYHNQSTSRRPTTISQARALPEAHDSRAQDLVNRTFSTLSARAAVLFMCTPAC